MIISLIVAADEHNGIGKNNQLLCHLPADLKYFKQTTSGHHIVMGRKTYDSIGRPLPNRVNMVITRNSLLNLPGCVVVADLKQAIDYAAQNGETELFITGGGTIYEQALSMAHRIYLTRIHHNFDADTFFPVIEPTSWKELSNEFHEKDEKNVYDYTFQVLEKLH